MSETAVAIVIPVRNEASFLSPALDQITGRVGSLRLDYRVVLVENGSADDTYRQAAALAGNDPRIRALRLPGADYGRSVRRGLEEAAGSGGGWIFLFQLDRFSGEFVKYAVNSGADAVVAAGEERGRRVLALRAPVAAFLLDQMERDHDLPEAEMLIRAEKSGLRIDEAPMAVEELRPPRSSLLRRLARRLRGAGALRRSLRRRPPRPAVPL